MASAGCRFFPPDDVAEVRATVTGMWSGAVVTLRMTAGDVTEDLAVDGSGTVAFERGVVEGSSYVVSVVDDGPDHDCAVTNGSGRAQGEDVDLAVECTNLIPHGIAISTPVPFTFDPRVTSYSLPVSILQQGVEIVVNGPTLTGATVAGQPVTIGQASPTVPLVQGTTTVPIVVTKGTLSQRYELVFHRGGTAIVEAAYAQASNAGGGDSFGASVAASGEYAAIGAYGEDSSTETVTDEGAADSGAVYVFRRAGTTWGQTQILKGTATAAQRRLGNAIAMDRDVLVVGAQYDPARATGAGAIYVFRLDAAAGMWRQEQRVTASDAHAGDRFGGAVAVSGDRIVVGAPGHDRGAASGDFGIVYVLARSGNTWVEEGTVRDPASQALDSFGSSVAFDADTLVVGDGRQGVHAYRRSGATWTPEAVPAGCSGPSFDVEGELLAVGQPSDASGNGQPGDQSAPLSGAVRVYARSGTTWSEVAYLKALSPQPQSRVGLGMALRANTIVTTASGRGALQAFEKVGGSWVAAPLLPASGPPSTFSGFGFSVALSANGALVGSAADDGQGPSGNARGTAWFFR